MPNFSIPLSGLTAASQALAVISNNLANLNTTGFKRSSVEFQDLIYSTLRAPGAAPLNVRNSRSPAGSICRL